MPENDKIKQVGQAVLVQKDTVEHDQIYYTTLENTYVNIAAIVIPMANGGDKYDFSKIQRTEKFVTDVDV